MTMHIDQEVSQEAKKLIEASILVAEEPINIGFLKKLFAGQFEHNHIQQWLQELQQDWQGRGVELVEVATGWRFQTKAEVQDKINAVNPEKPPKYSRAVMETLAIIAYRQPVTRGDIEEIRGVAVASNVIRTLEARGWVEVLGHREVPGKPALYGTTKQFLDDLNIHSLSDLPPLMDLQENPNEVALTLSLEDAVDSELKIQLDEANLNDITLSSEAT
ncbi:MAG TPA: SMC-Scp complex subunit ScpB [Ferrovaceae bacterium]|nr:SMC-Scp complex subunit ScpB [Ferrovaceae bacterium]HQU05932.1 SMC-Scp complex subunit ScpB [Ferrovaceae bacterium]